MLLAEYGRYRSLGLGRRLGGDRGVILGLGNRALGRAANQQGHECEGHEGCEALEHGHDRVCSPLEGGNYAFYQDHLQILSKKM
ncbi:hypothetical protein D3C73_1217960 [compost metagenome]